MRQKTSFGVLLMSPNFERIMKNRVASREIHGSITCPSLVIRGRGDQSWSVENGEEMTRLIPEARPEVIEDAGHFPTLSQPKATTAALRTWLFEDRSLLGQ